MHYEPIFLWISLLWPSYKVREYPFGLLLFDIHINQSGILALRMWYLFTSSRFSQHLILAGYIFCTLGTITTMILAFPGLHSSLVRLPQDVGFYCLEPPASKFWLVFIPSFLLHAILCVFMVLRVVRNVRISKSLPLTQRLMKEWVALSFGLRKDSSSIFLFCSWSGGFLYTVIFCASWYCFCGVCYTNALSHQFLWHSRYQRRLWE